MMKRLFIAIALPRQVKQQLSALLPEAMPGLRPVMPQQMHITLHFLGDAEPEPVVKALRAVRFRPFTLSLAGAGRFNTHGKTVCWIGVSPSEELSFLHGVTGRALAACGYQAEKRSYKPHISLLRAKKTVANKTIRQFLEQLEQLAIIEFRVSEFCLYSSQLTRHGPCYTIEERFS